MNRYTVLLVDDEKVIREGCRRAFAASGFRVVTATNGREALDAMSHERIDAILCDLKMPVMGAMGVLAQVASAIAWRVPPSPSRGPSASPSPSRCSPGPPGTGA